jgi:hypothetical protein
MSSRGREFGSFLPVTTRQAERKTSNDFVMIDEHDGFRNWYASSEECFGPVYLLQDARMSVCPL